MSLKILPTMMFVFFAHVVLAADMSPGKDDQQRLLQEKIAELNKLESDVQKLRDVTGTPAQIRVDVQMLEVSLTKLRERGIRTDWFATGQISTEDLKQATESYSNGTSQRKLENNLQFVDWLREQNFAKSLASPSVVVLSGQPAKFHVGGNFPIPTSGDGIAGSAFRNYGTELEISALALGNNQVRLEYVTRVSTINQSHAVEIDGMQVPRMNVFEVDTGCELPFGQTAIMAGLVQKRVEAQENAEGQVVEKHVDVGLMVVITPALFQRSEPDRLDPD